MVYEIVVRPAMMCGLEMVGIIKKTDGGAGCGRDEGGKVFIKSHQDGQNLK